jgi:hypothetical protein
LRGGDHDPNGAWTLPFWRVAHSPPQARLLNYWRSNKGGRVRFKTLMPLFLSHSRKPKGTNLNLNHRSVKVGHAPVGTMPRPPRRHFKRKHMVTWGKFRLPSTDSPKNKTRVLRGQGQGGGRGGSGVGGGGMLLSSVVFFCPRETHTRRLVGISTCVSRRRNFREMARAKCGGGVSAG